jgi:hypothetical protein
MKGNENMMTKFSLWMGMTLIIMTGLLFALNINCESQKQSAVASFPILKGPYLGQETPGDVPLPFAPGIITTGMYTRDVTLTPDGNELYFCVSAYSFNLIFYTKQIDGIWSEPAPAPFIKDFQYMYYEPHVTPNGRRLLFLSNKPSIEREEENEDIWAVDRIGEEWGEPYNLGSPVNSEHREFYPSTTRDGTIYFTRQLKGEPAGHMYRSRFVDGRYSEPEKLGPQVNCGPNQYNAFIDPDERYIIVPVLGRSDSYGSTDYYIVFRNENDHWSEPVNMGEMVNTKSGREYSPYISPDGKYFFFMSSRIIPVYEGQKFLRSFMELSTGYAQPQNGNTDIFWIDAGFIAQLRPQSW